MCSSSSAANARIDAKLARSRAKTSTVVLPLRRRISSMARAPRAASREVMITRAPSRASPIAVSLPMPAFPPVITTVFPSTGPPIDVVLVVGGHDRC